MFTTMTVCTVQQMVSSISFLPRVYYNLAGDLSQPNLLLQFIIIIQLLSHVSSTFDKSLRAILVSRFE